MGIGPHEILRFGYLDFTSGADGRAELVLPPKKIFRRLYLCGFFVPGNSDLIYTADLEFTNATGAVAELHFGWKSSNSSFLPSSVPFNGRSLSTPSGIVEFQADGTEGLFPSAAPSLADEMLAVVPVTAAPAGVFLLRMAPYHLVTDATKLVVTFKADAGTPGASTLFGWAVGVRSSEVKP